MGRATTIIGLSAYYHDSAVAVIREGRVVCAAPEERFSRRKNDPAFPARALRWCMAEAGLPGLRGIDAIAFHEKPLIKFERLLETHLQSAPFGLAQFTRAMPGWLAEKLMARRTLARDLRAAIGDDGPLPPLLFNDHHGSHAAAAFFASPFDEAAVLCLDGVGEWDCSTAWTGRGNTLQPLWRIPFPHSPGLLYSAFASFCGFRVNSGEYKLMGLAPYGEPVYADLIESRLMDLRPDGSFRLDMRYFDYAAGRRMTNRHFARLFGGEPLPLDSTPTRREMDLAASIQAVTTKVVLQMARHLRATTGLSKICLGGGVALNCVATGSLQREGIFEETWTPPSPGDAGSAIGAALATWHEHLGQARAPRRGVALHDSYLGPSWRDEDIPALLRNLGANHDELDEDALCQTVAALISRGAVVGWFQGRMEFGPRALGSRSILGDPRDEGLIRRLNLKIKHRESFRPFAPSVLAEHAHEWFDLAADSSPFMQTVAPVATAHRRAGTTQGAGLARIHDIRSAIPAVTHIDMSARLHTVTRDANPRFHRLISRFHELTGVPLLVNTSFNVRGEPLVATPHDAWACFMGTDMDALAIGRCLLLKERQAAPAPGPAHHTTFAPD